MPGDDTERCPDCGDRIVNREEGIDQCRGCSKLFATDGGTDTSGTERTVAVDRAVLEELVEVAKGKIEADVSKWGPEKVGYDLDALSDTVEEAERPLQTGSERYQRVPIHLCQSCGDEFEFGDKVVSLSDGWVDEAEAYDVNNRRFWHRDCFPAPVGETADKTSTDTDQSEDGGSR